ncbi:MAG TPA: class I SAM-dependent methyltransferase [Bacillota bacterium]|nr:class I SAM-dependent methyltransferase [Bacillota bacterium]
MPGIRRWKQHNGPVLDTVKGFDVIECEQCGFKHIVPIPTAEELDMIYRDEYYSTEKPLYLERYREDLDWWNLVYSERYDLFENLLPPSRRRILDIGSGPGFFLLHGKERGWHTLGIEPSAQAAAHSRELGLDILEDFFNEETVHKLGCFDVVHMSEVLEHVPNPRHVLRLARLLLNLGGLLCVVVPNDYNPIQRALRAACGYKPWWVAPPHHINYFEFDSLADLFQKNGFEIVSCETTFPIDLFLLMGDNYIGNDILGRQCHAKRKNLEKNLAAAGMTNLKKAFYRQLAGLGIGREVVLTGKVKEGDVSLKK